MSLTAAPPPLFFDDVVIGEVFVSNSRPVTTEDLRGFTDLSGDYHPIHTDEACARTTVFGRCILQGPFGIAVALGMFGDFTQFTDAAIALTDISDWRFLAPVFVGDSLTLHMTIVDKRRLGSGDRGIIQRQMVLVNQDGKTVQQGFTGLMMKGRPRP